MVESIICLRDDARNAKGRSSMKRFVRWDAPTVRREAGRTAMLRGGAAILSFGLFTVHSQSRIT